MAQQLVEDQAWVTLATNDTYALGALVLAESLNRIKSTRKRVVMVTPTVTPSMRTALAQFYHLVHDVDVINSPDPEVLALTKRPELGVTLTKVHCWSLTQFTKCVFLDADTLVIRPCDELFDRDELSAVCDIGWPDCFNSGVFVFKPSIDTFHALVKLASQASGSFDGGDQGLLNQYFDDWFTGDRGKHLSFVYNMTLTTTYTYAPAFKKYGLNVKIVHFLGPHKPWLHPFDFESGQVKFCHGPAESLEHVQYWWSLFAQSIQKHLSEDCSGLVRAMAEVKIRSDSTKSEGTDSTPTSSTPTVDSTTRRQAWESGHVDYLGSDSYENIEKNLDSKLN